MMTGTPIGVDGEPVPWFTYPAIEYLRQFDFSDMKIFEYGAGHSSLFWAKRAKQVTAVDSDKSWRDYVASVGPPNLRVHFEAARENYVTCVTRDSTIYDVIVIDGRWRDACADICVDYLSDRGMIIFDNSDRPYEACKRLREKGFFQVDFSGFGPVNGYAWTTSFFIRGLNAMQMRFSDPTPLGGLTHVCSEES